MDHDCAQHAAPGAARPSLAILTTSFNDWPSLQALLPLLDQYLSSLVSSVQVVVIDDGSSIPLARDLLAEHCYRVISRIDVVTMIRNLGSQRAISVGVGWIAANVDCDFLVVMDCDHEDRPEAVPDLLAAAQAGPDRVVFAARTRRQEGQVFKAFYAVYKALYYTLTGVPIAVGNFSIVPRALIRRLAGVWEIGIHFPSGIMKAKLPYTSIGAARGRRLFGRSNLNFVSFIIHGMSGIAVHAEVVAVRVVLATMALTFAVFAYSAYALFEKYIAETTPLGWTSQILAIFGGLTFQALVSGLLLLFIVLNARNQRPVIPLRDFATFVLDVTELQFGFAPTRVPLPTA